MQLGIQVPLKISLILKKFKNNCYRLKKVTKIYQKIKKENKLGDLEKDLFDWKPGPGVQTKFPKTRNDISPLQEEGDLCEAQVKHVHLLSHANLP